MADYLHIHVQTYRKIEKNPELATIKQAKMISEYLNMPYDNINFFNS
ncbi:MAG: helix-turn-helix domain-containing protein [Megasphaera sp.]|nr:helix-turn-helix domain-containing protein [Megasphaera sp.]